MIRELSNETLERHLLGTMLVDPGQIDSVTEILRPNDLVHFPDVFRLLAELHDSGDLIGGGNDAELFAETMRARGMLAAFGGPAAVGQLCRAVAGHAKRYASQIQHLANRRRTLGILQEAIESIQNGGDCLQVGEGVASDLDAIRSRQPVEFQSIAEVMERTLAEMRKPVRPMVYSGLEKLDRFVGGFGAGELAILSASTGGGKSALALQMAHYNAKRGRHVLFLTFEMRASEEAKRIWAATTGITVNRLRRRDLTPEDFAELEASTAEEGETKLHIDYRPSPRWREIERTIRAYRSKFKPSLIVVDYVGLVTRSDSRQSTQEKIAEVTGGLKAMAGQLECPILGLVQLNREAMKVGRAGLFNMADSSSIERDADIVLAIQQAEKGDREEAREIEILKHRAGQTGIVTGFEFDGARMRFFERSQEFAEVTT